MQFPDKLRFKKNNFHKIIIISIVEITKFILEFTQI